MTMQNIIEEQTRESVQSKKELERTLIKSMTGNYKVSFKFAETFATDPNYEYGERHFSQAKEVAFILEETENKISLQHILFVGKHLIKHWRQDWIYENTELLVLEKNHHWKKIQLTSEQAKGTWTQKVYQVDDCPRYQGYGTWVHVDGRHFWESTADAALPRREISTAGRTDYNILRRHSHIELFEDGSWLLEQDNEKINKKDNGEEALICWEKGFERFTPKSYDASKVMNWWEEQKEFWNEVRLIWDDFVASTDEVILEDDEKLYMTQFELAEKFSGEQFDAAKVKQEIRTLLAQHVKGFLA